MQTTFARASSETAGEKAATETPGDQVMNRPNYLCNAAATMFASFATNRTDLAPHAGVFMGKMKIHHFTLSFW